MEEATLALIPAVYDALVSPGGFQDTFRAVQVALDVPAAGITFRARGMVHQHWAGLEPAFENAYVNHYHRFDPWVDAWQRGALQLGEVFGAEKLSRTAMEHNPCYQELCLPHGYHDLIGTVLESGERMVSVAAFVRADLEHQQRVRRVLQELVPHLRRAAQLHMQQLELRAQSAVALDLLERFPAAVLAVDRQGRLLRANRKAQLMLLQQDGLAADAHGVRLGNAERTGRLVLALVRGEATTLRVPRPSGSSPLAVVVAPVGEDGGSAAPGTAALLYVLDPDAQRAPPSVMLRDLFGLTPAEARLALELAHGATPQQAAQKLGVSWNTTRTQLKAVLAKTGTNRQAALVQLLAALAVVQDR